MMLFPKVKYVNGKCNRNPRKNVEHLCFSLDERMNVKLEASSEQKRRKNKWIKRIKTQFHTKNTLHLKDCNAIKLLYIKT